VQSVATIQKVLSEFESLSSLKANPEKSTFFCAGVPLSFKTQIVNRLKMCERKLHVRYLGAPTISSRLCATDCDALLEIITVRINSWLSRNLSFSSRLQLVSIVFKCTGLAFSYYLRKSLELLNKSSIVFFGMVRMKGLLELRFLGIFCVCVKKKKVWNCAALMRHIWSFFVRLGSLWVVWEHAVLLKGRSFWQVRIPQIWFRFVIKIFCIGLLQ
jgi:hypothetical protein